MALLLNKHEIRQGWPGPHFFKYEVAFTQLSGIRCHKAGGEELSYLAGNSVCQFLSCRAARGYRLNANLSAGHPLLF